MHLGGAGLAQHADDLAHGVAAHDRVVHDHQPLAAHHLGQRVELHPQAVAAQLLPGLDERAGDVAVLDQAVVLRDAGSAREALRRGVAGVGDRDHEIGVDRRLAGEDLAHPAANRLERAALELGVRAREVDVLEDAQRGALGLDRDAGLDAALVDRDQLTGLDLAQQRAPMMSSAQLSEATT